MMPKKYLHFINLYVIYYNKFGYVIKVIMCKQRFYTSRHYNVEFQINIGFQNVYIFNKDININEIQI